MTDAPLTTHRLRAAEGLDLEQGERRPVRQHQPPDRRRDAREGAAGRPPSAPALFAGDAERREGHGDVRGAAGAGHSGAEYDAWLINIDGDQFGSGFVAVNPNSKIPALLDRSGPTADPRVRVRRDPAVPRREVRRVPADRRAGARRMPVVAVLADGQRAVSRRRLRPLLRLRADQDRIRDRPLRDGGEAPARRARPPAGRQRVPRRHEYTIADMAIWPWYGALVKGLLYGAGEFLSVHEYKNVQRWTDAIAKRPAVKRGRMVNRISGEPASQLHERHDASDFDTKTQDKIGEPAKA